MNNLISQTDEMYKNPEHEADTCNLGMWVFLSSEVLFFGGGLSAYFIMRFFYSDAFAEGSSEMNVILGTVNTFILLLSSALVAVAEKTARDKESKPTLFLFFASAILAFIFLCIKGYEYYEKFKVAHVPGDSFEPSHFTDPARTELFFWLYFALTSLHALHVIAGIFWVCGIIYLLGNRKIKVGSIETYALYWHFVDVVWIFLFPAFYLIS